MRNHDISPPKFEAPPWLTVLRPAEPCRLKPVFPRSEVLVWRATLEFVRWNPPQGQPKPPFNEGYNKVLMAREDGSWTVGEIELVRRFRNAGWNAGWIDTFGHAPQGWAKWIIKADSLPDPLGTTYKQLSDAVHAKGGPPDVVAWRDGSLASAVFVESKVNDMILADQEKWFREAMKAGISQNQLAIVRWGRATV